MRGIDRLVQGVLLAAVAACGGGSGGYGGLAPGDGGGDPPPPPPPERSATITVGNNFFRSDRNQTVNAAVDTVTAGRKATWTWRNTGAISHSIRSVGAPAFPSGAVKTGNGSSYELTFDEPGTYRYNCAVHGDQMSGTIVVKAP